MLERDQFTLCLTFLELPPGQPQGSVGGKVEAFYSAFGDTDLFVVADVPDNVTSAALSLIVAATKKTATYRPPGQ